MRNPKLRKLRTLLLAGILCCAGTLKAQTVVSGLSAFSGAPGTSVTISGSGFNISPASNVVYFGGTKATITSTSATSLTVTVPTGATYMPVSVTNTATGLTGYSRLAFAPTFANSAYIPGGFNFEPKQDLILSSYDGSAIDHKQIDIDGDGKQDIVTIMGDYGYYRMVVYRNISTPGMMFTNTSFAAGVEFSVSYDAPVNMDVADLDGDGKKDVIIKKSTGGFCVFRNTASSGIINTSSFAARQDFGAGGIQINNLVVGDINADGKPDVVYTAYDINSINAYQNTSVVGTISFSSVYSFDAAGTYMFQKIALGDIDGDGKVDLLADRNSSLRIYRNLGAATIGSGSFASGVDFSYSNYALYSITISDMDGDSKQDIVLSSRDMGGVVSNSILKNVSSSGTINSTSLSPSVGFNFGKTICIADIDGDGKPDITSYLDLPIATFYGSSSGYSIFSDGRGLVFYRNQASSGVINASSFAAGVKLLDLDGTNGFAGYPNSSLGTSEYDHIIAGDLDGDSKPDLSLSSFGAILGIIRNNPLKPSPTITAVSAAIAAPGASITITGTNFNTTPANNYVFFGAGRANVTVASTTSLTVTVPLGATALPISVTNNATNLAAYTDKAFLPTYNSTPYTPGTVNFDPHVDFNGQMSAIGDIDGDGKPDMVVLHATTNTVSLYRNTASAGIITTTSFASAVTFSLPGKGNSVLVRDIDGDGRLDVIVGYDNSSGYAGNIVVFRNQGSAGSITSATLAPYSVFLLGGLVNEICDIDGDGKPEIISFSSDNTYGWVYVLQNISVPGNCAFATYTTIDVNQNSYVSYFDNILDLRLKDIDGDGKKDIVIVKHGPSNLVVLRNKSRAGAIVGTFNDIVIPYFEPGVFGTSLCFENAISLPSSTLPFTYSPMRKMEFADIDGDGVEDMVVFEAISTAGIRIRRHVTGPGIISNATFDAGVYFPLPGDLSYTGLTSVRCADVNGDGKPDVICSFDDGKVRVMLNAAIAGSITSTSLLPPLTFFAGGSLSSLQLADMDGDSKADIIVGSGTGSTYTTSVLRNNPFAATPITGSTFICQGTTTALNNATTGGTWSSSNAAVATVSVTGIVTGISEGPVTITYSFSAGGFVTKPMSVRAIPSTISGPSLVCAGSNIQLGNAIAFGTWSTSNTAVATIGSVLGSDTLIQVNGITAGTAAITYTTGCAPNAVSIVTVSNSAASAGTITGAGTVCPGTTTALSNATTGGVWSSGNTARATVGVTGIVSAFSAGTVRISYTVAGCPPATTFVTMTVNAAPATGTITGTASVCAGGTTALSNTVTGGVWSSNNTVVATVDGAGMVSGVSNGTAIISYAVTSGGCSGFATRVVTVGLGTSAGTLSGAGTVCTAATITLSSTVSGGTWMSDNTAVATVGTSSGIVGGVTAGTANISYTVSGGCGTAAAVKTITVNATPSAGSITGTATLCTSTTTALSNTASGGIWSSGNTAIATVNASGVVTGVATGNATISYTVTSGGCTAYATRIVTVSLGGSAGTLSGAATVCAASSITLSSTVTGGTWASSNTAVATVGTSSGVVTGATAGTAMLSYTTATGCGMALAVKTVTVNAAPWAGSITGTAALCLATTTTLGNAASGGVWSSSNTAVANIDAAGIVTGITNGTSTISYTTSGSGCFASATLVVTVGVSASAGGISGIASICTGATSALSSGSTGGTWSSDNTTVATVGSGTGLVSGVAAGTATISYTVTNSCGSAVATRVVTVSAPTVAGTISGASTLCTTLTTTLTATIPGGVWTSSNANATVSAAGVVTGVSAGAVNITYAMPGACGAAYTTKSMTVSVLPVSGTLSGSLGVCLGSAVALSSTASGGVWTSSNTAVGTIGAGTGIAGGLSTGTTTITYTVTTGCGAATSTAVVTVNALPAASGGTAAVCIGSSTTLTNVAGTWSSANTAIATVGSSTGVVSGVSAAMVNVIFTQAGTGCARATVVTVNPLPAAVGGALATCAGSTDMLTNVISGGTWASSNTTVATIGSGTGTATALVAGNTTISYVLLSGCMTTAVLTVNAQPATVTGTLSACVGATTALATTSTGGTWTSGNVTIATINGTTGVVSGIAAGTVAITYTLPVTGCRRIATVTINALPGGIGGPAAICPGSSVILGSSPAGGTWVSGSTAAVTVHPLTGFATGVAAGVSVITYTAPNGCSTSRNLTVEALPTAITGTMTLCAGSTTTLASITTGGLWLSADAAVAVVSPGGVVSGIGAGTAAISYTSFTGCVTTAVVTVNTLPSALGGLLTLCAGNSVVVGSSPAGGTWASGATAVATVGTGGLVTAISAGIAPITYTAATTGCRRVATFTINALPTAIGGPGVVCAGSISTLNGTPAGGTWSNSGASSTINTATGVVTGVAAGSSLIIYTLGTGCTITRTITTNPSPSVSGAGSVCVAATTTLTATIAGGTWSTPAGHASVGSGSGVVTGVSAGTSVISYTIGTGCAGTKVMTINPLPVTGTIVGAHGLCEGATTTLTNATTGGTWSAVNGSATVSSAGLVTGVAGGTDTILYTVNSVCGSAAATFTVTINPLPLAAPITGGTTICVGTTTSLTSTTPGGVWSSADISAATVGTSGVVTGINVSTVTIRYTATNSCGTTITTVSITVLPLANAGAITGGSSVCPGETITLVHTAATGLWASATPALATVSSSGVVSGLAPGTAKILYVVANVCSVDTAAHLVTVRSDCSTGISKVTDPFALSVYPNPNTGAFTVQSSAAGMFVVYTLEGKELQRNEIAAGLNALSLPKSIASGIYMCRFTGTNDTSIMVRLVYEAQ